MSQGKKAWDPENGVVVFVEKNGKEIVSVSRNYGYYSVDREINNLWDLYRSLVEDPSRYFYFITALNAPIGRVKIIDKSRHSSPIDESKA